ncbi:MAG: bifunctional diaminohydroxyphosphoribosylaminopyrimidine deaminase/5-amino-6-(5-phosphoribosylamino)uracil reductase RibD [Acidobacteria bacterium]|nr:bifunctional diaminohydroxyphosphoribosylaminopyrimidine deaminase/5-amino-6-(5-phosphoribosylamino)uracil reductase RibD [Acidobacteriota bacterium]
MQEALELAYQGRALASPNPMVGAVLVNDGVAVGRGFHTYGGVKHAEILALEQAGERSRGSTLFINLEPCCHQGRTPPCTDALIAAGIARVVAAMEDPNPQVGGAGFERLAAAGIAVERAPEFEPQARRLNEAFGHFIRTGRPLVTLKTALTLDGKISAPDDNTGWITSERARAHVQQVRHDHDAILTGIGTVLADDCLLTDRTGLPRRLPLLRVVVDSQLRLPLSSKMVRSFQQDLVVATTSAAGDQRREALAALGISVLTFDGPGGRVDLDAVVRWLGEQQKTSLIVEAGAKLNWAALEAGVVDKVLFYYAPKILGGTESLPLAAGPGRRSRSSAIVLHDLRTFPVAPDEFVVEAYVK